MNRNNTRTAVAICAIILMCTACKEKPAQSTAPADAVNGPLPVAPLPKPVATPVPEPPPSIKSFDNLDVFWKPTFDESTEIVWTGKATSATGRLKGLRGKPCTASLIGEKEVKSELVVRCGGQIVYNSKQPAGGGFFAYSFTLIEVIPTSEGNEYRYQLAYKDTGNRPDRPQAQLVTGGVSKVLGEEPPDFTLNIAFGQKSRPRTGSPLYYKGAVNPTPYKREVTVTKVSGRKDVQAEDRCELGLVPYGAEPENDFWCIAELTCGKETIYGKKDSVLRKADAAATILPCKLNEKGELLSVSDEYNRIRKGFPRLSVTLAENSGTLEDETSSLSFTLQNAEQIPESPALK